MFELKKNHFFTFLNFIINSLFFLMKYFLISIILAFTILYINIFYFIFKILFPYKYGIKSVIKVLFIYNNPNIFIKKIAYSI